MRKIFELNVYMFTKPSQLSDKNMVKKEKVFSRQSGKLLYEEKSDVIIHVGLHKTGTSFLQKEVFPNIKNAEVFGYANKVFNFKTKLSDKKINIISEEGLSGNLHTKIKTVDRETITSRLHAVFPDAKIIVVFRNKEDWIKSLYSEYIKLGGYETFNYWKTEILDETCLNFDKYEKCLKKLFDYVLVCRYEDLKNDTDVFIKNICDFICVKVPEYDNKYRNIGLDDTAIRHWRKLNRWFKSVNNPDGLFPMFLNPLSKYNHIMTNWMKQ